MKPWSFLTLLAFGLCMAGPTCANESFANESFLGGDKPFAEAHIVLQLGDDDARVQARVINVANNLIKHYGDPERVDIEIVTYDAGISLLYPDNINADRISGLLISQVKFIVCMNTVETMTRINGKKPELIPASIPVSKKAVKTVPLELMPSILAASGFEPTAKSFLAGPSQVRHKWTITTTSMATASPALISISPTLKRI